MNKPVDAIETALKEWPGTRRGFVIVLPNDTPYISKVGFARVYGGFRRDAVGRVRVHTVHVEQPDRWYVFDTYTKAYETALWIGDGRNGWAAQECEIAEIERRAPVKLLSRRPVSALERISDI